MDNVANLDMKSEVARMSDELMALNVEDNIGQETEHFGQETLALW